MMGQRIRRLSLRSRIYIKGYKDNGSKNHEVQLGALTDPDHFIVCPVKWLLILALRTGAVSQIYIEDLQRATERTFNKSLIWKTPDNPVLAAFKTQGCMLDLGKAASEKQVLKTLKEGCHLIGLIASPVAHDIRRGAAAEIAHLPEELTGTSIASAATVLNHSSSTRDREVTKSYVGHIREDTWERRLETDFNDDFGPDIARQPFKRARQSTKAVLEICDELGLDFNDPKHRIKAQETGKARLRDEWIKRNENTDIDETIPDDNGELGDEESVDIEAKNVKDEEEDLEVHGVDSEDDMVYPSSSSTH